MRTQKPAARRPQPATLRPPLAARHSPPATHYLPPAQAADNKIQNDRQKTHSCNDKVNTIYSFIQIGRESALCLCKSKAYKTSLFVRACVFLSF